MNVSELSFEQSGATERRAMEYAVITQEFPMQDDPTAFERVEKFAPLCIAHVARGLGVNRGFHTTLLLRSVFVVKGHAVGHITEGFYDTALNEASDA